MTLPMYKNFFKPEIIISYFGILPFFFIIIDLNLFSLFLPSLLKDFLIFYSLIIFSFIGAMRWEFSYIDQRIIVLYGFSPSLISTVLIIFNLLEVNQRFILLIISFLFILQLAIDFIICKFYKKEDSFFNFVRIPCTFCILLTIIYVIFV